MKGIGIFLLSISLNLPFVYGQKEDFVWRIGYSGGISFNNIPPDTFSVNKYRYLQFTNAAISDSAGNFLFFTNGANIFNRNSDTLLNGESLNPSNYTSSFGPQGLRIPQADIFIRRPGFANEYYLFHETVDNDTTPSFPFALTNVLYQTVVDITLDGGLGGVTDIKNRHIYDNDTILSGVLSAVRHANGRDWWLITKKYKSPIFYKWLITPDSILGPYYQFDQLASTSAYDYTGQACFSPSGDKYAVIYYGRNFYLYDFDRCSGDLNYIFNVHYNDSSQYGTGCAFSSSGRYLYTCTPYFICQYDMLATDILASQVVVAEWDNYYCPVPSAFSQMRLAPDGKIYISTTDGCAGPTSAIHYIEYPDSAGIACNVRQHAFYTPSGNPCTSLPSIPDYKLGPVMGSPCDTLAGIHEAGYSINMEIYPNPSYGIFKLKSENAFLKSISLFNSIGQFIETISTKEMELTFELSRYPKGIYFVKIQQGDKVSTQKIVLL